MLFGIAHSTVTIDLEDDGEFILLSVDDEVVPHRIFLKPISKIFPREGEIWQSWPWALFCRITVENWGGSIGYSPVSQEVPVLVPPP